MVKFNAQCTRYFEILAEDIVKIKPEVVINNVFRKDFEISCALNFTIH